MKSEPSRTFIGTVLCIDLVGYSRRTVNEQSAIKGAFNRLLSEVILHVRPEDRIILDTGDGAAVSFLGDPEVCLTVGLELRDRLMEAADSLGVHTGEGPVRIGMNLGPLKVTMDMNGHPNIIGDGLNTAERVMSFAQPGQIVASRSFHSMVSRLSAEHTAMFHFEGKHTDKNAREHEIYLVEDRRRVRRAAAAKTAARKATAVAEKDTTPKSVAPAPPGAQFPPAPPRRASGMVEFLRSPVKVGITAVALVALIFVEAWMLDRKLQAREHAAPAIAQAKRPATAPTVVPAPRRIEPVPATPAPPPKVEPGSALVIPKTETPPEVKADTAPQKPDVASSEAAPPRRPEEPRIAATRPPPPMAAVPKVEPPPVPAHAPPPAPAIPPPQPVAPRPAPVRVAAVSPVSRAPLQFPRAADRQGIASATVKARLGIDAEGRVTGVTIIESTSRLFDHEAIRSLEQWRFNPGAAQRTYDVEIEFKR